MKEVPGKEISLHNLNDFSGFFELDGLPLKISKDSPLYCGISMSRDCKSFGFSIIEEGGEKNKYFYTLDENKSIKEFLNNLLISSVEKKEIIICCEISFFRILSKYFKDNFAYVNEIKEGNKLFFYILPNDFVRCYLEVLFEKPMDYKDCLTFYNLLPCDVKTFNFLRLLGMPHSAQDIVRFLKSESVQIDSVLAGFEGGVEWYWLAKSKDTPPKVDPIELGLTYFPICQKYKHLLQPYYLKLAVIKTCKKYHLSIGYDIMWHNHNKKKLSEDLNDSNR